MIRSYPIFFLIFTNSNESKGPSLIIELYPRKYSEPIFNDHSTNQNIRLFLLFIRTCFERGFLWLAEIFPAHGSCGFKSELIINDTV
ncbi:hypothetical protein P872_06200 [Rhodonellum psychrophilum GCM71 = DSM 17998]|uniref:Uncharacterized protein n=1 Tax=Rhodonellum psychrophilum GCM71 = DSM 17998 TaxID=1123057 RepID=U5C4D1_9BACT|nr:hypothetical protein P872_06200 [Rhodonellum psychrophilum GCM71 = DSM 17998]